MDRIIWIDCGSIWSPKSLMVCFIIDIHAHRARGREWKISVSLFIHFFFLGLAWHSGHRYGYVSCRGQGMTSCILC